MSQPEREQKGVALLRGGAAQKGRAPAASDVLCRSLADEAHQLRRTLAATAHMCQHLAECLDARQRATGDAGERSPEVGCGVSTPRCGPRCSRGPRLALRIPQPSWRSGGAQGPPPPRPALHSEGAGQGAGPGSGVRGRRPTGLRGAGLWLCMRSGRGGDSVVSASGIPYLGDQGAPGWGCWEHGARPPSLPV